MSQTHILNGDALKHQIDLQGEIIVFRECMINGPLIGNSLSQILANRKAYFKKYYHVSEEEYTKASIDELRKLEQIKEANNVFLWFEDDLFCQIHLWCSMNFINENITCYLVSPFKKSWNGFGKMNSDELQQCFKERKVLNTENRRNLKKLWQAFQHNDWEKMKTLGQTLKHIIHNIEETIKAHIDRFPENNIPGKPERILLEILSEEENQDFSKIFQKFTKRARIYGFGDVQVKLLLDKI